MVSNNKTDLSKFSLSELLDLQKLLKERLTFKKSIEFNNIKRGNRYKNKLLNSLKNNKDIDQIRLIKVNKQINKIINGI